MKRFLFLFLILLTGCQDRPKRERVGETPLGYRGQARLNPYLAAERYLEAQGWSVDSSRTWSNYGSETSVIFMPGSFLQTKGMALRVLEWVYDGGMLVLTLQGGEPDRNDFTSSSSGIVAEKGDFMGLDEILELFEIEVASRVAPSFEEELLEEEGHLARDWELSRMSADYGDLALEFEGRTILRSDMTSPWDPEVGGGSRVLEGNYGSGSVVFLAHARPFRSPYLARADHADFLEFLAHRNAPGDLVFLYGSSTSFFGLLWKEGRMVVIAGLCALAAWLWMRIPRFGLVLRDRAIKPTKYGESLTTSARFLWRTGKIDCLIQPLRDRIEHDNDSEGNPELLYDRLVEESGLSRDEVKETLTSEPSQDPGKTLKLVEKLQLLLRQ